MTKEYPNKSPLEDEERGEAEIIFATSVMLCIKLRTRYTCLADIQTHVSNKMTKPELLEVVMRSDDESLYDITPGSLLRLFSGT